MLPDNTFISGVVEHKGYPFRLPEEYIGIYEHGGRIIHGLFCRQMTRIGKGSIRAVQITGVTIPDVGTTPEDCIMAGVNIYPDNRGIDFEKYIGMNPPHKIEIGQRSVYGFIIVNGEDDGVFSQINIPSEMFKWDKGGVKISAAGNIGLNIEVIDETE